MHLGKLGIWALVNQFTVSESAAFAKRLEAWGDEQTIRKRLQQHLDAGADQVCIQSPAKEGMKLRSQDERIFELLAADNL